MAVHEDPSEIADSSPSSSQAERWWGGVNPFPFKRAVRIEMVPLIDMFFLLLVFFIFGVFHMTTQQGLLVEMPTAHSTVTTAEKEAITITLTADEQTLVNAQPVTEATLREAIRRGQARLPAPRSQGGQAQHTDPLVIINADRRVPHGRVIGALDAVRELGLSRVSFRTEPEPSYDR